MLIRNLIFHNFKAFLQISSKLNKKINKNLTYHHFNRLNSNLFHLISSKLNNKNRITLPSFNQSHPISSNPHNKSQITFLSSNLSLPISSNHNRTTHPAVTSLCSSLYHPISLNPNKSRNL